MKFITVKHKITYDIFCRWKNEGGLEGRQMKIHRTEYCHTYFFLNKRNTLTLKKYHKKISLQIQNCPCQQEQRQVSEWRKAASGACLSCQAGSMQSRFLLPNSINKMSDGKYTYKLNIIRQFETSVIHATRNHHYDSFLVNSFK